jgi:hypothetical protein
MVVEHLPSSNKYKPPLPQEGGVRGLQDQDTLKIQF